MQSRNWFLFNWSGLGQVSFAFLPFCVDSQEVSCDMPFARNSSCVSFICLVDCLGLLAEEHPIIDAQQAIHIRGDEQARVCIWLRGFQLVQLCCFACLKKLRADWVNPQRVFLGFHTFPQNCNQADTLLPARNQEQCRMICELCLLKISTQRSNLGCCSTFNCLCATTGPAETPNGNLIKFLAELPVAITSTFDKCMDLSTAVVRIHPMN